MELSIKVPPLAMAGFLLLTLSLSGCNTTTYTLAVDAISDPKSARADSYRIIVNNPGGAPNEPQKQEVAKLVKTALSARGLYEVADAGAASMVVRVDYGISPPRIQYKKETVEISPFPAPSARPHATLGVPIPIYEDVLVPSEVYEKHLTIAAEENQKQATETSHARLWSVSVSAEDESNDLDKYLPIMAAAAINYIGRDSETKQTIKLKSNNPDITFILQGSVK